MKRYKHLLAAAALLAALAPFRAPAAINIWQNLSTDGLWNTTSLNWTGPTMWQQGDDAFFCADPAGDVTLGANIKFGNINISSTSRKISAASFFSTNSANTVITAGAGTSNNIALSIYGSGNITFAGSGTSVLLGDASVNDGNHYTGNTYVRSGTVILRSVGANGSTIYAVSGIQAIDAGATVQFGTVNDGTVNTRPPGGQILNNPGRLNLTGGTLDGNGDDNGNQYPPFEGTGTIMNSSVYKRAVMKTAGPNDGSTFTFAGNITDGGPNTSTLQGVAHQMGVDMNGGNYKWVWSGSNSFTGFIRFNSNHTNNSIKLVGAGTLGYPPRTNAPGRHILMNAGLIDLNGTSQNVGYVYTGNDANSIITNSAIGTTSTLTVMVNNTNMIPRNGTATPQGIRCALLDDPTTGGTLALTMQGPGGVNPGLQPIGDYPADGRTAAPNNYHGDTTVNSGVLEASSTSGISPNSAYRLNSPGVLQLDYAGTANVKQLFVNGVPKNNGTYGAADAPGIITGGGTLTVTGSGGNNNTWLNVPANATWDTVSSDWTSPASWSSGDNAVFGVSTVTNITLGTNINANSISFSGPASYTLTGNLFFLTNGIVNSVGGTSNTFAMTITGTNGLVFNGYGTNVLVGEGTVDANHYTGGTYIHGGTVIAACKGAATAGQAIDSIEALDGGALLQMYDFSTPANAIVDLPQNQFAYTLAGTRMHLTGGTLDLNGWRRNGPGGHMRVPEGTGLIINNNTNIQSALVLEADGLPHTFAGQINDGGPVGWTVTGLSPAPFNDKSYQIGIINITGTQADPTNEWVLSGANNYSGSTRLSSMSIKLVGAGTMGKPSAIPGWTGPMRLYQPNHLDLNGHNQTIAKMANTDAGGSIYNSAVGTVSTFTFGYGDESNDRTATFQWKDNTGTGGILALTKVGLGGPQGINGVCTYSGDTTVVNGTLRLEATQSVAANSAYRLTNTAALKLAYAGTAPVRQLWINGMQQPNGVYGAGTTGIDAASTGTITVTGYNAADSLQLQYAKSGDFFLFSWLGSGYKLQSKTNILGVVNGQPWLDFAGGGLSPVCVPINKNNPTVVFRLSN